MSLAQLAISVFIFLVTITYGIAQLIKSTNGLFGFCYILLLVYLSWILVSESYREYQQEKNK